MHEKNGMRFLRRFSLNFSRLPLTAFGFSHDECSLSVRLAVNREPKLLGGKKILIRTFVSLPSQRVACVVLQLADFGDKLPAKITEQMAALEARLG